MKIVIAILIELIILVAAIFLLYGYDDTIQFFKSNTAVEVLIRYFVFVLIIDIIKRFIQLRYSKKDNFYFGINNIANLLLGVGLVVSLFGVIGIDFKSLITSISIVAAAVAIILKDYISDFIVGIYFSFSKNFEIGDYVKIGDLKGKIQQIEMLKIKLLNDDDDLVIIPNIKIYSNEIINYTKKDIRLMSVDFQLDINAISRIEKLEAEIMEALISYDEFIEKDTYNLKIVDIKKDYIDFKFQYTLKEIDRDLQRDIRKKTVRKIFNYISSKVEPLEH